MNFFLPMKPPTVTHQMQKVRVVKGKPVFYDPPEVREARQLFIAVLAPHAPAARLTGPVSLTVIWLFPKGSSHENGEWRVTRPDTDNLQKLLKDCMSAAGFWTDDAQVCREVTEKHWADDPTGIYIEVESLTGKEAPCV